MEDLTKIVDIEIKSVAERLKEQRVDIELDASAKKFIIEKGFDKVFGARPLKRAIQRYLENPLAEEIISGSFKEGVKIHITRYPTRDELKFDISTNLVSKTL